MSSSRSSQPLSESSSALVAQRGSFASFLAPLTQDTFKQVISSIQGNLEVVYQTLSWLEGFQDHQGFELLLDEMLQAITLKIGELLNADRTTIFLLDEEKDELWSIVAKNENGNLLEIRLPTTVGIAGEVACFKKAVNIPFDFYDDPRSATARRFDQRHNYRTYTMLALPLLNEAGDLVAVVQLLNKLKPGSEPFSSLAERIDLGGFTEADEATFQEFAPSIKLILESSRLFYTAAQKQRAATALMKATQSLSQSSLDLEETLKRVMDEAKELLKADRSAIWLLDEEARQLWTKLPIGGVLQEIRIPASAGFAGQVATTGEPVNIGFDLYSHPNSETSKQTDQRTGYRTCSLLCMPIFNANQKLIGVTQLINKKKQGEFPPYDAARWPEPPECWKASFTRDDQEFMQAFNIQAGVALENAKLFATVKQQEEMQRNILRSLSNAVIATDHAGRVMAVNESARHLLNLNPEDHIEGQCLSELIHLKENDFAAWFGKALEPQAGKPLEQYYPEQILMLDAQSDSHSVNLTINTIADATDPNLVRGALVVMEDISQEKRLKNTMYRYMTQELAERLMQNSDSAKLGGDRKDVSVLFSDIRGYTTLTEHMPPEDVVEMLNEYFEQMVEAIFRFKGTLDKYIGDAIMAVFGSPLQLEDHAWYAVQAAIEMRHRLVEFNTRRKAHQLNTIAIGIGINTDSVISGNIGSSKRMEFTAIGDGVNLGSRLEGASKQYGCDIIISDRTYFACEQRVWARELDCIRVKGKTDPVSIFELIGIREGPLADQVSEHQLKIIEYYQHGLELYRQREFTQALREFNRVLQIAPNDKPALMHKDRCWHLISAPPAQSWDGVWTMTEK